MSSRYRPSWPLRAAWCTNRALLSLPCPNETLLGDKLRGFISLESSLDQVQLSCWIKGSWWIVSFVMFESSLYRVCSRFIWDSSFPSDSGFYKGLMKILYNFYKNLLKILWEIYCLIRWPYKTAKILIKKVKFLYEARIFFQEYIFEVSWKNIFMRIKKNDNINCCRKNGQEMNCIEYINECIKFEENFNIFFIFFYKCL